MIKTALVVLALTIGWGIFYLGCFILLFWVVWKMCEGIQVIYSLYKTKEGRKEEEEDFHYSDKYSNLPNIQKQNEQASTNASQVKSNKRIMGSSASEIRRKKR